MYIYTYVISGLRALSYVKFSPGVKFLVSIRIEKIDVTHEFQSGTKRISFLLHFTPGENMFANICIFYKRFLYAVTQYGLYQNYVKFH